ncbi:unnamed protein product [Prorocentrum cordatum]|uniref:Uncharacterized protein n=1 Tax=Prorocentrum cordatum TaxID=2364126 RepID=A0ABN9XZJ4_9DINO|nr:unnamed protein product [Polarella glacialis]
MLRCGAWRAVGRGCPPAAAAAARPRGRPGLLRAAAARATPAPPCGAAARWRPWAGQVRVVSQVPDHVPTGGTPPGPPPVHPFILEVGRGFGQVAFCPGLPSAALIFAGLCVGDPKVAVLAALGCTSATAAARLVSADAAATTAGLYGYNGVLLLHES